VGRVANTGAVDETRQNTGIYESAKRSQRREMGRSYQFDLITRENPTPQKPVARGQQRKLRARRQALPQSPQERATPKELLGDGQPSNGDPSRGSHCKTHGHPPFARYRVLEGKEQLKNSQGHALPPALSPNRSVVRHNTRQQAAMSARRLN
jgi:hypothetical protein